MSQLLTVTLLYRAKGANHSSPSLKKEQMSKERCEQFDLKHKKEGKTVKNIRKGKKFLVNRLQNEQIAHSGSLAT